MPTAGQRQRTTVSLTFFVDPGNRVYVRNITFSGVNRINDEVLRREMRQLEGGWLSNTSLERSKQRIQRLPYVKNVEFETTPVAGAPDLVDVNFKIEEGPAAQLGGGIGYSETYRVHAERQLRRCQLPRHRPAHRRRAQRRRVQQGVQHLSTPTRTPTSTTCSAPISLTYSDVTQFVSSSSNFSSQDAQLRA